MSTKPDLTINNVSTSAPKYHANPYPTTANIMFIVITHLRCGCAVIAAPRDNAFRWGNRDDFAHAKSRGSPFQMPTRLADGLGPESDRADGSPPTFAPSRFPGIWFPRADLQEGKPA